MERERKKERKKERETRWRTDIKGQTDGIDLVHELTDISPDGNPYVPFNGT